jgi:xylose isomerase
LIGLGLMGTALTERLLEHGFRVAMWNRTRAKAEPLLARGAEWSDNPLAICERVIISLCTTEAVEAVLAQCDAGLHAGQILLDTRTGDELIGWDTDQFPTSIYLTTLTMLCILKMGGFSTGGVNFDAKVRRESFEPIDLFHAHIGGMDAFARGLKLAAAIRADGRLADFVKQRYASWDSGIGAKIEAGKASFEDLEVYMLKKGEAAPNTSGRQEYLEILLNEFI